VYHTVKIFYFVRGSEEFLLDFLSGYPATDGRTGREAEALTNQLYRPRSKVLSSKKIYLKRDFGAGVYQSI
jgi:hypothetical protein